MPDAGLTEEQPIVCSVCLYVYGHDTDQPTQCVTCKQIVGCFKHPRRAERLHVNACFLAAQQRAATG